VLVPEELEAQAACRSPSPTSCRRLCYKAVEISVERMAGPRDPKDSGGGGWLLAPLIVLLPLLCCGLPLLIAAGAAVSLGSILRNPVVIAIAGALTLALGLLVLRRCRVGRRCVPENGRAGRTSAEGRRALSSPGERVRAGAGADAPDP
jgi:hypothetical protein